MDQPSGKRNIRLTVILIVSVIILAAAALIFSRLNVPGAGSGHPFRNLLNGGQAVTGNEASAYVLYRDPESEAVGVLPLPENGELSYSIRRTQSDGTETENILHLTPDGFCMESSTCKNQNCVEQGTVTLDNREIRILQNCVVCLPNRVTAELYTAEEIRRMISEAGNASE